MTVILSDKNFICLQDANIFAYVMVWFLLMAATFIASPVFAGSGLQGLWVGPGTYSAKGPLLKPFVSDGCTIAIDGLSLNPIWKSCCITHDAAYWLGGTRQDKDRADHQLFQCVAQRGYPKVAEIYFKAVRKFGLPNLPTPFRWGFGWNCLRPYGELKKSEIRQAAHWYGRDVQVLRRQIRDGKIKTVPYNDMDESLKPLSYAELQIYNHLQKKLAAPAVVRAVDVLYFNLEKVTLNLYLSSCKRGPLQYTVSKKRPLRMEVYDPERCLE